MRYGFYLPTRGPLGQPDALAELVQAGEKMGFASVVIADHIVFPVSLASTFPYSADRDDLLQVSTH